MSIVSDAIIIVDVVVYLFVFVRFAGNLPGIRVDVVVVKTFLIRFPVEIVDFVGGVGCVGGSGGVGCVGSSVGGDGSFGVGAGIGFDSVFWRSISPADKTLSPHDLDDLDEDNAEDEDDGGDDADEDGDEDTGHRLACGPMGIWGSISIFYRDILPATAFVDYG